MHSYGMTLHHGPDATTYTALTSVRDLQGGNEAVTAANSSHLLSPSATKTFEPGMIDPGEITFNVIFAKAVYTTLRGFLRVVKFWKVTDVDGDKWEFQGLITSLGKPNFNDDDSNSVMYPVTVKQTGPTTYTAAA